jgi:chemosensory pili system protein ChpE/L-lysine exporter family protein LysE/ArgO
MLALFATAFVLGLVFNAAPGVVFAETVRQGIRGGYRGALAVQVGSLVGDASWALLGLAGIGLLLQVDALRLPIGLAGAAYLAWLAWDSWRAASQEFSASPAGDTSAAPKALRAGMLLSLTNPQNVAYWAAIGSAMGAVGIAEPSSTHYAVFFAGFMVASVVWSFVCAAIVARLFRDASSGWAKLTYRLCAAAFLALALSSLRELVHDAGPAHAAPAAAPTRSASP